jgi:hypothetical protein
MSKYQDINLNIQTTTAAIAIKMDFYRNSRQ